MRNEWCCIINKWSRIIPLQLDHHWTLRQKIGQKSVKNCNSFTFPRQKYVSWRLLFNSLLFLAPNLRMYAVTMLPDPFWRIITNQNLKNRHSFTISRQKYVSCWSSFFYYLFFLAPICVRTLKWLIIVAASWSILTHHDESEFELKNKMQFVAQHTIHIVFYYVCVQKFFFVSVMFLT